MHSEHLKPSWVGAILVVLTVVSVAIAELLHQPILTLVAAFGFAAVKGQLIALHFMEIRRARKVWSALYRTWIVAIACVLLIGGLFAPHG